MNQISTHIAKTDKADKMLTDASCPKEVIFLVGNQVIDECNKHLEQESNELTSRRVQSGICCREALPGGAVVSFEDN